jgi:hypothetical protein
MRPAISKYKQAWTLGWATPGERGANPRAATIEGEVRMDGGGKWESVNVGAKNMHQGLLHLAGVWEQKRLIFATAAVMKRSATFIKKSVRRH